MATTTSTTSTSAGSAVLTALGSGSGVDTTALVKNLVAASFDPKTAALKAKETANGAKISQLATLTNKIDSFSDALSALIAGGTLSTQPTSSSPSILTATAKAGARIGALSAQLAVRQIAQPQSLVSGYVASAATTIGSGTITIAGSTADSTVLATTITLDGTNRTLSGIARAINAKMGGMTASVVTDANGARLSIKGQTGADGAFSISVGAGSDAGLAALAYPADSGGTGMIRAQAAQDAVVRLDGVDVTRPTNEIDDLVDGVTLKLVSASPATTVSLSATRPSTAIKQAVSDFVAAYNEMKTQLATATAPTVTNDDGTVTAGALYGNSAVRQMQSALSKLSATVLNSGDGPCTLADIGVSTNRDGTLALDETRLAKAINTYPDAVEAMFNPGQHASSPLVRITSAMGVVKPGTYTLTDIVAGTSGTAASGKIDGTALVTTGDRLYASVSSGASGLVIEPLGDVATATITVDAGIGGALKAIRDGLRASGGVLAALSTSLTTEQKGLATERTKMAADEDTYRARLVRQYSTMDTRVSQINAIKSYLTQQIAVWTKDNN